MIDPYARIERPMAYLRKAIEATEAVEAIEALRHEITEELLRTLETRKNTEWRSPPCSSMLQWYSVALP